MTESTLYRTTVVADMLSPKKPTVILAISDPGWINQFQMLPRSWDLGYCRVAVHGDPQWVLKNGIPETNFDILLTPVESWKKLLPPHRVCVTPRLSKTDQGIAIAQWMQPLNQEWLASPVTFGSNLPDRKHPSYYGPDLKGRVVIKPEDGARGVSQILVDFDEVSVSSFLKDLYGPCTWAELKELYITPAVVFSDGAFVNADENENNKKDGRFTFQAFVPNIEFEVRILTNHNADIGFICHRTREGEEYKQATGVARKAVEMWTSTKDEEWLSDRMGPGQLDVFKEFLKDVVGPMQSVDLFITETSKWGVLEYCNQYGIAGVPPDYYTSSVKAFAEKLVAEFWAVQ